MDIEVGLGKKVPDLVDPWLQFPVFEDRRGVAGRAQEHGWQGECDNVENKSQSQCCYHALARTRHTFTL